MNDNNVQLVRLENPCGAGFKWAIGAILAVPAVIAAVSLPVVIIGLATGKLQEGVRDAREQMNNMNAKFSQFKGADTDIFDE